MKGVVVVTGAHGAIGRCIVTRLACAGYSVYAVVRPGADVPDVTHAEVQRIDCDLESDTDVQQVCVQLQQKDVSFLVLNAAIGPGRQDTTAKQVFQVNIASHLALTRAMPRARIVSMSSRAVDDPWTGSQNSDVYAATKSALESLARSRERELGQPCFSLVPGAVETKMLREIVGDAHVDAISADEVAKVCVDCVMGVHDAAPRRRLAVPAEVERVTFCRRYDFCASHTLSNSAWSGDVNRKTYGKCSQLHGHNYVLWVELNGIIHDDGFVCSASVLDAAVHDKVLLHYDHANLNDLPQFAHYAPTVERIALDIRQSLMQVFNGMHIVVRVEETARNSARAG